MRKVSVDEAVGLTLGYDITKIVPGREKYRAFRRGQVIEPEDIAKLKDMGKEHIYVWDPDNNMVHEDDAALHLAKCAAGAGISWGEPSQGRVNLKADYSGLLKVRVDGLNMLNSMEDVVFATLHNDRLVAEGQAVAGTRVVPVAVEQQLLQDAAKICSDKAPILAVLPFQPLQTGVVTTGTEVNSGRIKDGFAQVIRSKIAPYAGSVMGQVIVPDNSELISQEINKFIAAGAEVVIVTGGMSVDADDVTPQAIRNTGAEVVFYGAPILPGSQFMLAYQGQVPICGVPGGALYSPRTTFDLLLPRIFAQDRIRRSDIIAMGHGGLCEGCEQCHFPQCPFGKATPYQEQGDF